MRRKWLRITTRDFIAAGAQMNCVLCTVVKATFDSNVCFITQTVYWILTASKGWIKQTYRKNKHTQNTQNYITGNDLVQIE